jgi:hypothetical protein
MRKITYKTLSIQNFLSVGNDVVDIDFQNGLNLIMTLFLVKVVLINSLELNCISILKTGIPITSPHR